MTLPVKNRFDPQFALVDKNGQATQVFRDYLTKLDAMVTAMPAGNAPSNPVNAGNDSSSAPQGVVHRQFYRNGSLWQVRVV